MLSIRFTAAARSPMVSMRVPSRSKAAARMFSMALDMRNSSLCSGVQRQQPFETQKPGAQARLIGGRQRLVRITQRSQQQIGRSEVLTARPDVRRGHGEQPGSLGRLDADREIGRAN